jgi:hypothetical protein
VPVRFVPKSQKEEEGKEEEGAAPAAFTEREDTPAGVKPRSPRTKRQPRSKDARERASAHAGAAAAASNMVKPRMAGGRASARVEEMQIFRES